MMRHTALRRVNPVTLARRRAWTAFRRQVIDRDGRCVFCGRAVNEWTAHVHHRQLKSRGGRDTHSNCVTLCATCHGLAHDYPNWATDNGLMVPARMDPFDWPVLLGYDRIGSSPRLWQAPNADGVWIVRPPHPDQQKSTPPWEA